MFEATDETWRTELASRESYGIAVRLVWSRSTNLVTVAVADAANDDYFAFATGGAMQQIHHPLAGVNLIRL